MNARIPTALLKTAFQKDSTVFTSGNSQAIRIPKDFQFKTKQVTVIQRGEDLIIRPKYSDWAEIMANLPPLTQQEAQELDQAMLTAKRQPLPMEQRDWSWLQDDDAPKKSTKSSKRKPKIGGRA